ncbi:MAG: chromate transporter [Oscillospiraceae bacterium]|jgi:chromate transporter|nr:chromate transporter [Oscillospiraceae bacterium]MDE6932271.1 chromate transporter [Oscillospiraceae bacterium]MDE7042073.1 chromate transporter [Oscillospiraceae bacterium]
MLFLRLFYEFFKTGLFAVGGGMATIPFLYNMADSTGWFTRIDVDNMIAVGESTPGPIGVNMATYVGYITGMNEGGLPFALLGAVVATLGLITPSIIVILIIASFLKSFRDNRYVESAFYGLRPASTGLIAAAGLSVAVTNLFYTESEAFNAVITKWSDIFDPAVVNWKGWALAAVLWVLTNKVKQTKKLHPIIFILGSAVVGIVLAM